MTAAPDVVETSRLILRRFDLDADLDEVAAIYADPEVVRFLGDGRAATREETRAWLERNERERWETHGFGQWAVVERGTGRVVGRCGLQPLEDGSEVEVGYVLGRSSWGEGYATEAARAAVRAGFTAVGLGRIVAVVHVVNIASQRVIDKLGFAYERDDVFYGNPCRYYAAERVTWLATDRATRPGARTDRSRAG